MKNRIYQVEDLVSLRISKAKPTEKQFVNFKVNYNFLKTNEPKNFKIIGFNEDEYVIELPSGSKLDSWKINSSHIKTDNVPREYLGKRGWYVQPRAIGGFASGFVRIKKNCKTCDKFWSKKVKNSNAA